MNWDSNVGHKYIIDFTLIPTKDSNCCTVAPSMGWIILTLELQSVKTVGIFSVIFISVLCNPFFVQHSKEI